MFLLKILNVPVVGAQEVQLTSTNFLFDVYSRVVGHTWKTCAGVSKCLEREEFSRCYRGCREERKMPD